ncbi:MAG TPA: discoidin domain-containing protein [Methylomirabilota bacterium]|nr:discoidin domain-containing protein [Methylomirabilota bacterium]
MSAAQRTRLSPAARFLLAVLLSAAAVRLALLWRPRLWFDEATVGIMGLAVLRGELPIYFFGQAFMGALGDAYLAAPVHYLLGASAFTLELVAVLQSLLWLGLVVGLAWHAFGPRAGLFTALCLAIPPDYLLYWSHEARPHYLLSMALGTLALLVALRAPLRPPRRAALGAGLLGFVLGLAFWTNFLSLVFFPAVAVLLLTRGVRLRMVPVALVALPTFVLGSLPHWLYGLPHDTAFPPAGDRISAPELLAHALAFARVAWPTLAGVPRPLRDSVGEAAIGLGLARGALSLALGLLYGAAVISTIRAIRRAGPAGRSLSLALVALVVVSVGVAVGTEYGESLEGDPRYLLPLYTALPILVGRWLASLAATRAAAAMVTALLAIHAIDAATGSLRVFMPEMGAAVNADVVSRRATIASLERAELRRLYAPDFGLRILTFTSRERVIFSSPYEEIYPRYALAVDGAPAPGWWLGGRSALFEENLRALGVRFAYRELGPYAQAYVDFELPEQALRELDPGRLRATASEGPAVADRILDRDAATLWSTVRPQAGGEWIQLDLGRPEPIAMVRWLPGTYQEVPTGLRLEASLDGRAWQRLLEVPRYFGPLYWSAGRPMGRVRSGRVELRTPPTPARYLRITQTGRNPRWPWTIRELFAYAACPVAPAARPVDDATLARAIGAAGVTRLYADHGWGSRVALADPEIRIVPANLHLDAYGFDGAAADLMAPPVRWDSRSGALLEPADVEGFTAMARAGGLGFRSRSIGGLTLFTHAAPPPRPGTPLPVSALRATASRNPDQAPRAVDGDPRTGWASGHPQTPGDWVRIDLARPHLVRAVRLWTASAADTPRGVDLEGSTDGVTWRPIGVETHTEGLLRWGGITLLRDRAEALRLDFAPMTLRALRLTLTRVDPAFDWAIDELAVFAAE